MLVFSTIAILYGTLFPSDYNFPKSVWSYDKLAHFAMFGVWTFFYGIVRFLKGKFSLLWVFFWGSFFGVMIELLQFVLPTNRSAELLDLAADIAGSGFAVLLLYLLLKNVFDYESEPAS